MIQTKGLEFPPPGTMTVTLKNGQASSTRSQQFGLWKIGETKLIEFPDIKWDPTEQTIQFELTTPKPPVPTDGPGECACFACNVDINQKGTLRVPHHIGIVSPAAAFSRFVPSRLHAEHEPALTLPARPANSCRSEGIHRRA